MSKFTAPHIVRLVRGGIFILVIGPAHATSNLPRQVRSNIPDIGFVIAIPCRLEEIPRIVDVVRGSISDQCLEKLSNVPKTGPVIAMFRGNLCSLQAFYPTSTLQNYLDKFLLSRDIILVVGNPIGLESALVWDIVLACVRAEFSPEAVTLIVREIVAYSGRAQFYVFFSRSTRLTVIVDPSVQEFEDWLGQALESAYSPSIEMMYCGHGEFSSCCGECGIVLSDGSYSFSRLMTFFGENFLSTFPAVHLMLNCCYATALVADFLCVSTDQVIRQLVGFAYPSDCTAMMERYNEAVGNRCDFEKIQKEIILQYLWQRNLTGHRNVLGKSWGSNWLYLWPLSMGDLPAVGAMQEYCNYFLLLPSRCMDFGDLKITRRLKWYENPGACVTRLPLGKVVSNPILKPLVTVFKAGKGNSCLLQFHSFAMLVDGGIFSRYPCFWDTIKHLNRISYVLLTHGDDDHVNGLLPLFARKMHEVKQNRRQDNPEIESAAFTSVPNRGWALAQQLRQYCDEARIPVDDKMYTGKGWVWTWFVSEDNLKVTLTFVLPSREYLKRALDKCTKCLIPDDEHQTRGGLSDINKWGISVAVKCEIIGDREWNFLFTGDADGKDIWEGLERIGMSKTQFDYVDIPHHGSDKNSQSVFLANIKAKNLLVSTNGDTHYHPDKSTCQYLCQYLEDHSESKLYFNYHDHPVDHRISRKEHQRDTPVQELFTEGDARVTYHSDESPLQISLD